MPGDGRLDNAALLSLVQSVSREHHVLDMQGMAQANGTAVSAVMFGALAVKASRILPLACGLTLLIHTLFYLGLRVPLPWGVLIPIQW